MPNIPRKYIYHFNGDVADNRKSNLIQLSQAQFEMTKPASRRNVIGLKGVCFHKKTNKWRAQITVNRNKIHLGNFPDSIKAAEAYNNAVIKYYGKYAYVNDLEHFSKTKLFDLRTVINLRQKEDGFIKSAMHKRITKRLKNTLQK